MNQKHIAIVGAGFAGLIAAKLCKDANCRITVFEKNDKIGGVWHRFANESSHVQTLEPTYRFETDPESTPCSDFTPRDEMLASAEAYSKRHGVFEDIRFNTEVKFIQRDADQKYRIAFQTPTGLKELLCNGVIMCPGGLHKPNEVKYPGEEKFRGKIVKGISDDISPEEYVGKNVVIVGCGAFGIENMRTALNNGAKQVTILSKRFNTVLPRYAVFKGGRSVVGYNLNPIIKTIYESVGRADLIDYVQDEMLFQKSIFPVSDIYFIALYYEKLLTERGSIAQIRADGPVTTKNKAIKADIIIKSIGFRQEARKNIEIADIKFLRGPFVNGDKHFMYLNEGPLVSPGESRNLNLSLQSFPMISRLFVDIYLKCISGEVRFDKIKRKLPFSATTSISMSYYKQSLASLAQSPKIKLALFDHVLSRKKRTDHKYSEEVFVAKNREEWELLCTQFSKTSKKPQYPYPFPMAQNNLREKMKTNLFYFLYALTKFKARFGR